MLILLAQHGYSNHMQEVADDISQYLSKSCRYKRKTEKYILDLRQEAQPLQKCRETAQ